MKKIAYIASICAGISAILYVISVWYIFVAPIALILCVMTLFAPAHSKRGKILVLLCFVVSAPAFYGLGKYVLYSYFGPSAEIILPNGFSGRILISGKQLETELALHNLNKHYSYKIPDNGVLEHAKGWIYLSFNPAQKSSHTTIRYENGTMLAFGKFNCIWDGIAEMIPNDDRTVWVSKSRDVTIACSIDEDITTTNEEAVRLSLQDFINKYYLQRKNID